MNTSLNLCSLGGIVIKKLTNDNRVRVTRALIREAFTTLLKEKPIERITVKELCEKAGINRGTFYGHYNDMYELRSDIENELVDDFERALEPFRGSFPSAVTDVTASIFRCLKNNSDICEATLGSYGDKEFILKLIDMGKNFFMSHYKGFFEGADPSDIDFFYSFVSRGFLGVIHHWFKSGTRVPCDELADMVDRIMLHGVGFMIPRDKRGDLT